MDSNLTQIDNILQKEISNNKTPSVCYYLFNTDTVLKEVHLGFADLKGKLKANKNTFYKAFSATKTFTALAVLQLAEQAKLNLDDLIYKYLPNFVYGNTITIKQVLSHSAGIPNPIPLNWIHSVDEHANFDRDRYFESILKKHSKTKHQPNQKFAYSNLGYFILGQLIEKISGLSYETYIEQNIIKRLGLDTASIDFQINFKNAIGYNKRISFANAFIGWFINKSKFMQPAIGKWKPYNYFYPNGASYAGLIGTPRAFVTYLQALLKHNSVLLSDEFKKQLFSENITNNGKPSGMSLGWFTDQLNGIPYLAHPGGAGGYYCELRIYPEQGVGSVVFFNRTGMSNAKFLDKLDKYYFQGIDHL
ncbi:MAG: serine hydrolase domain-containing protein [Cyclobacteriaceae bacterium]